MKSISILFLILTGLLNAQNWQKIDSVFSPSGVAVSSFTSPSFADLNNDNQLDLLLGNTSGRLKIFMNKNAGSPPSFSEYGALTEPIYTDGLQNTNSSYASAIDLDGDLDLDLIISGFNGLLFYDNIGDQNSPFLNIVDTVTFSPVNELIGSDGKPAFADLDGDGDYDLIVGTGESFIGGPEAGLLMGFRNIGDANLPVFVRDDELVAGLPDVGLNAFPALGDLDDDGDFDLLVGRDASNLRYFRNDGDSSTPSWTAFNSPFSGIASNTYWNSPTLIDLDNDGDLDLCYGNTDGRLFYYENTGDAVSPSFQSRPDYFSIVKTEGNGATVSLADYDGDGDNDLISGNWLGDLLYFENTGDNTSAAFVSKSASFTNISLPSIYSTPRFVDVNNDNDVDIVSGLLDGKLYCYINNNGTYQFNGSIYSGIDLYGSSNPAFADLDADGDIDVLVGSDDNGSIGFYENDGDNNFTLNNSFISDITFNNYSQPTLSDLDNDGDFDLIIGRGSGKIDYYQNDGTPEEPVWTMNGDLFDGIEVKQNAYTDFADMDNDGKKDLIIGEYDGNFTYYKNLMNITSVEDERSQTASEFHLHQNYPNPFNPATTIQYSIPVAVPSSVERQHVSLIIYDILGNEVATLVNKRQKPGRYKVTFDAANLSSGLYLYKLISGNFSVSKKMILLK